MSRDQEADQEIAKLRASKEESGLRLEDIKLGDGTLLCDTSMGRPRPVVPRAWEQRIFTAFHGLSHAGPRPTARAILRRFVWHGAKGKIRDMARACLHCQASKVARHIRAPLQARPPPTGRFMELHVDLVGPLPACEGNQYLFTIVDRFTRWPEAVPMASTSAEDCARVLLRSWIARFGVPASVTTDRGPQFTSRLWAELHKLLGIKSMQTTAYHPQANGMVERLHRTLKASLMCLASSGHWMDALPLALLGFRSAWREDADISPAELVYGAPLTVPGEFVTVPPDAPVEAFGRQLKSYVDSFFPPPLVYHGLPPTHVPPALLDARWVLVRRDAAKPPLTRPYEGPFEVVKATAKYFIIKRSGKDYTVSVDRLKKCSAPVTRPSSPPPPRPMQVASPRRPPAPPGRPLASSRQRTASQESLSSSSLSSAHSSSSWQVVERSRGGFLKTDQVRAQLLPKSKS